MEIAAAVNSSGRLAAALDAVIAQASGGLNGQSAHLGVVTVTNHFEDEVENIAKAIRERTGVSTLIGCTAEGVIGPTEEVERQPGLALWLAHLPDVRIRGFHLHPSDLEEMQSPDELRRLVRAMDVEDAHFILLADPYFTPYVVQLLELIGKAFPGRPVFGGMASGLESEGQAALILDEDVFHEGAIGVVLSGAVDVSPVVSQGCRPVGKPFVITAAEDNVIKQLGGKPALMVLNDVYKAAPKEDQELMREGLFIGRAISEYQSSYGPGDFLIRHVLGADTDSKAISMGDFARIGTTVQFHVRDRNSAEADLRTLLARESPATGGLVFSCNGRGTNMFQEANHDLGVIHDVLGKVPVAGFFCAGEIGPVGGQTFVHGHTASIALFRPKKA